MGSRTHRRLLAVVALIVVVTAAGLVALWPSADDLPETSPPLDDLIAATVVDVVREDREPDPIAGTSGAFADVTVELLDGPDAGTTVVLPVNLDGYPEFRVGDRVALTASTFDGSTVYFITDFQRLPTLAILAGLFVLAVLAVGRWHGLRSLLGLGVSLLLVIRFVVPAILAGRPPALVALVGALAIMVVTLYLTHGINEMTTSAIVGTGIALAVTVVLGTVFVDLGRITGFSSDDAALARLAVDGLDLQGLVLAGLIIAALGVLDDVTVSQASTVFAIHETDRSLSYGRLFRRAMQVGRDHIASVVNTLFLAYAGASLAVLVLFTTGGVPSAEIVNSELLAEEIIKIVVGSIGLIAAVPLTTALAAAVARRTPDDHRLPTAHAHGSGGAHGHDDEDDLTDDERAARAWARYLHERGLDGAGQDDEPRTRRATDGDHGADEAPPGP